MFDLELLLTTAKGNQRWIRCIGEAEISEGKCTRIYGSFQDIHERKVAELEIKGTNERFEKVTKATNDAIWDWDISQSQIASLVALVTFSNLSLVPFISSSATFLSCIS